MSQTVGSGAASVRVLTRPLVFHDGSTERWVEPKVHAPRAFAEALGRSAIRACPGPRGDHGKK